MIDQNKFEIPLNIPNVRIVKVERDNRGDFLITVESTKDGACCSKCGGKINKFYGYGKEITLRHLPILGCKVYIKMRPKRYQCPYCDGGPTTTQKLSWYNTRSPYTKDYEDHVLLELINSTVSDVSIKKDIGYEAVMGIVNRRIDGHVNWNDIKRLDTIGIDEISLKKGHKDFVTIITCSIGGQTRILGIIKGREKEEVKKFLSSIPKRLKKTVKFVCCDMYDGYINAAKEVFVKETKIVADRFHVAKLYRKNLDALRKQEMKRLKEELPEEEYKKLKGAMWALRKDETDLIPEHREVLRNLFKYSPILKTAYDLCNELTDIFNENISKEKAICKIQEWIEIVELFDLECLESFIKTLNNRMDEITNYFVGRRSSGFVEGLNNKIKVIKRRCYGIFNLKHLFQRIYLDLEGYSNLLDFGKVGGTVNFAD